MAWCRKCCRLNETEIGREGIDCGVRGAFVVRRTSSAYRNRDERSQETARRYYDGEENDEKGALGVGVNEWMRRVRRRCVKTWQLGRCRLCTWEGGCGRVGAARKSSSAHAGQARQVPGPGKCKRLAREKAGPRGLILIGPDDWPALTAATQLPRGTCRSERAVAPGARALPLAGAGWCRGVVSWWVHACLRAEARRRPESYE